MNRQANQGGGFSSHCFFQSRRRRNEAVRALDYAFAVARGRDRRPCALGAPRLVSTPSSLELYREAWLGVASMRASGVSPNLKGSAPTVSGRALNRLSPLCLPISSPRQKGGRDSTIACTCVSGFTRIASRCSMSARTVRAPIYPPSSTSTRHLHRFRPAPQHPPIQSNPPRSPGAKRQMFVSCCSRNRRLARHREVTNVFDNFPAENVYIA